MIARRRALRVRVSPHVEVARPQLCSLWDAPCRHRSLGARERAGSPSRQSKYQWCRSDGASITEDRRLPASELVGEELSPQLLGCFFVACDNQGDVFDNRSHSCDAFSGRCALSAAAFIGRPRLVPDMRASPGPESHLRDVPAYSLIPTWRLFQPIGILFSWTLKPSRRRAKSTG